MQLRYPLSSFLLFEKPYSAFEGHLSHHGLQLVNSLWRCRKCTIKSHSTSQSLQSVYFLKVMVLPTPRSKPTNTLEILTWKPKQHILNSLQGAQAVTETWFAICVSFFSNSPGPDQTLSFVSWHLQVSLHKICFKAVSSHHRWKSRPNRPEMRSSLYLVG